MIHVNPELYLHLHHDRGRELSELAHRRHLVRQALTDRPASLRPWAQRLARWRRSTLATRSRWSTSA